MTLLAGLILLVLVGIARDPGPNVGTDAQYAATAAAIRARGYHCDQVVSGRRIEIDHQGNKHYRISCGYDGPHYRVVVRPDGSQLLLPMPAQ